MVPKFLRTDSKEAFYSKIVHLAPKQFHPLSVFFWRQSWNIVVGKIGKQEKGSERGERRELGGVGGGMGGEGRTRDVSFRECRK